MARGFNYAPGSSADVARAADPVLSREDMVALAASRNAVVRERIASRDDLTISLMATLANDDVTDVRAAVAANGAVSVAVLELLAQDRQRSVVAAVAGNAATPLAVLEQLVLHRRPEVSSAARETVARVVGGAPVAAASTPLGASQVFPSAQTDPVLQEYVPPSPSLDG